MAKDASDSPGPVDPQTQQQAQEQTGNAQVRLRIDEREMTTSYANGFRANGTAEEVMIDFGLNMPVVQTTEKATPEILFKVTDRVVLNYYSAKRLAITLSQLIRRHEEQFGELELDVSKRQKASG